MSASCELRAARASGKPGAKRAAAELAAVSRGRIAAVPAMPRWARAGRADEAWRTKLATLIPVWKRAITPRSALPPPKRACASALKRKSTTASTTAPTSAKITICRRNGARSACAVRVGTEAGARPCRSANARARTSPAAAWSAARTRSIADTGSAAVAASQVTTPPTTPPAVAPVPMPPTTRRAVYGSNRSLTSDQKPETRAPPKAATWR